MPEKISVVYLEINPKNFKGDVEITEKEIESYYEYNTDKYRQPKQVKATPYSYLKSTRTPLKK